MYKILEIIQFIQNNLCKSITATSEWIAPPSDLCQAKQSMMPILRVYLVPEHDNAASNAFS